MKTKDFIKYSTTNKRITMPSFVLSFLWDLLRKEFRYIRIKSHLIRDNKQLYKLGVIKCAIQISLNGANSLSQELRPYQPRNQQTLLIYVQQIPLLDRPQHFKTKENIFYVHETNTVKHKNYTIQYQTPAYEHQRYPFGQRLNLIFEQLPDPDFVSQQTQKQIIYEAKNSRKK